MKRFLKVLIWFFITFIVLSVGLVIFVQTNRQTVVAELKKQLNKYLLTEVQINDIDISSIKHFPNITVILDQVVVKEVPKESGLNLAELDKVYLVINLMDFIRKHYIIQKVVCINGEINIRRYLDNTYNYLVWKTTISDSATSDVEFKINKATFHKINLFYTDSPYKYSFSSVVDKCDLKGNLTESPYHVSVSSKTRNLKLKVHDKIFIKDDLVEMNTVLDYDAENEIFQLHQSKLWIDKNKIEIDGSYTYYFKNSQSRMDLIFRAKSLDYKTVFDYLPDTYKNKFKDYEINGTLSFEAIVNGVYDSKRFPAIHIDFKTSNTDISSKTDKFSVENIKLHGIFTNEGKSSLANCKLSIPEFDAQIDHNEITGNIVLQNFINPYLNLTLKSKINLTSFNPFIKSSGYLFDSGYADIDFIYQGRISEIKNMTNQDKIDAKLQFESVSISDKSGNKVNKLNGNIYLTDKQTIIKNFSASLNQTYFTFDGSINGLIPYLLKHSKMLAVNGNLTVDKMDLTVKNNTSVKSKKSLIIPNLKGIDADIDLKMNDLLLTGFEASDISGNIKVKDEDIIAKNMNFKTSSGNINLSGRLSVSPRKELTFEGKTVLSKIDLNKLFMQFNNFGQNNLTDKNLKGFVDADIELIISFDSNLNFIETGLYALADISISNGELVNYQTIQNLLGFIKLKKMDHVKFDKLQNTIIIKDRRIDIPKMTLKSSAFNMDIQGWHTFDNKIEYNMKVNLTQLFFGKNKIDKTQIENGEDDKEGGINLYVTMYGDVYDPQFKMNKTTIKTKVSDGIGNQKKEMKEILQKKKDEKNGTNDKQNNNNDFELEWDDN